MIAKGGTFRGEIDLPVQGVIPPEFDEPVLESVFDQCPYPLKMVREVADVNGQLNINTLFATN